MTHRVFSRNAGSSRAIPVSRLIEDIQRDPFIPLHWGANQKGMQAFEECNNNLDFYDPVTGEHFGTMDREQAWLQGLEQAIILAKAYDKAGYHKQIINRILEPWAHINVLVTSDKWSNFIGLRDHKDAEPHIQVVAKRLREALEDSTPTYLNNREWHLPFITDEDRETGLHETSLIQVSVARCARTSYLTYEGKKPTIAEDMTLYGKLITSEPLHASPAEHQAKEAANRHEYNMLHGNFNPGWVQYRKLLVNESL